MVAVVAKLAQQIVQPLAFRHKYGGTQQGSDIQFGRALELEQVFRQQDADDVFLFALKHRKPRVRGLNHLVQQLVKGVFNVQQIHPGGCHHHIASGHVGHADHALEHQATFRIDDLVVLGLGQGGNELVSRVRAGMDKFSELLQETTLVFAQKRSRRMGVGHSQGLQDMLLLLRL